MTKLYTHNPVFPHSLAGKVIAEAAQAAEYIPLPERPARPGDWVLTFKAGVGEPLMGHTFSLSDEDFKESWILLEDFQAKRK